MKEIKVLYPFKNSTYQFFLQDMADSLIESGMQKKNALNISFKVRYFFAKLRLCFAIPFLKRKKALIVLGGGYIDAAAFPFCYVCDIVPFLWDTWPKYWNNIISSFKRNHIKLAFFTQKQVANYIQTKLPETVCVHVPEGIDTSRFNVDLPLLKYRNTEVLEIGRVYNKLHNYVDVTKYKWKYQKGKELLFPSFDDLKLGLADSKIVICFPRSMTHPKHAGCVETLTQRYWEAMLSKTILLGHAPMDLIDLIGYNPVIELDFSKDVSSQIDKILANVDTFQPMVEKNYQIALKFADWKNRIALIFEKLNNYGYLVNDK